MQESAEAHLILVILVRKWEEVIAAARLINARAPAMTSLRYFPA